MTKQRITKHRIFGAWAFEKEVAWLNEMAAKGWQLEWVSFFTYRFIKTDQTNIRYQLDYQSLSMNERDDYLTLFEETGWEHCATYFNNWYYFRKPITEGEPEKIHTDNASRIKLLQRILTLILIAGLPSFTSLINMQNLHHGSETSPAFTILKIILTAIILLLGYGVVRLLTQIRDLKKRSSAVIFYLPSVTAFNSCPMLQ